MDGPANRIHRNAAGDRAVVCPNGTAPHVEPSALKLEARVDGLAAQDSLRGLQHLRRVHEQLEDAAPDQRCARAVTFGHHHYAVGVEFGNHGRRMTDDFAQPALDGAQPFFVLFALGDVAPVEDGLRRIVLRRRQAGDRPFDTNPSPRPMTDA
jgi:hypothetical protein